MNTVNSKYIDVLTHLGVAPQLKTLFDGRTKIPSSGVSQPPTSYGFPPALIPIWSDGNPTYWGVWKHWFVERELTFVRMSVEAGYKVYEVARTSRQLFISLVIADICLHDQVNAKVEQLARELGIETDLPSLDSVTAATGDDPAGFLGLPEFARNPPATCLPTPGQYRGEFPLREAKISPEQAAKLSPFELTGEHALASLSSTRLPRWFGGEARVALFSDLLDGGDLAGAWLTLNSPGWSFADAKAAISRLRDAANDPGFHTLVAAWLGEPNEQFGGY